MKLNPLGRNPLIPAATAAIKGWTREAFGFNDDVVVSVNELSCSEPGCPPRETVVLMLPPGIPPTRLSIHKAVVDVCEQDVIDARLRGVEAVQAKGGDRLA